MQIVEILDNKKDYMSLLLLADEQEEMVMLYLDKGRMFALMDDGCKAECVVTDEGDGILEIKNIAVDPDYHGKGYGRKLIAFIEQAFADHYRILQVGTGDSPLTVPFYERCGFVRSHVIKDFFLDHYDHPIVECGVLLKDMVYFQKPLQGN